MAAKLTKTGKRPIWKLPMCWAGMCAYRTNSDDDGVWGECATCGKRAGYVSRQELRAYADAEFEREQQKRADRDEMAASISRIADRYMPRSQHQGGTDG